MAITLQHLQTFELLVKLGGGPPSDPRAPKTLGGVSLEDIPTLNKKCLLIFLRNLAEALRVELKWEDDLFWNVKLCRCVDWLKDLFDWCKAFLPESDCDQCSLLSNTHTDPFTHPTVNDITTQVRETRPMGLKFTYSIRHYQLLLWAEWWESIAFIQYSAV